MVDGVPHPDRPAAWPGARRAARGPAYEGPLLDAFARHGIARRRSCRSPPTTSAALILFADGGPTLRATRPDGTGDHDLARGCGSCARYAGLQQADASRWPTSSSTLGVPDLRPERMAVVLDGFVADDAIWARADAEDRAAADAARERLPGLRPDRARPLAAAVAARASPATIQHDDLHGGNILVGPDGDRIFDWGDASVAHPFGTLTTTLNSIAHHAGFDQAGPELGRVRDAYLEMWSGQATRDELAAAARAATVLGAISRAASWERSFTGLPTTELDGHGGATAAWLVELVERLDRWAAAARLTGDAA